jgi:drug/metabolite transporter (DMT)-like permease
VRSLIAWVAARPRLTALLGAVSISLSGVLYILSDSSPETASFFRCLYGLPLLLLATVVERRSTTPMTPMTRRHVGLALFAGVLFAGDIIFWHHSIEYVGAGLATVLGNMQVVVVAIGAWLLFGERPSARTLIALPIILGGVVLIAGVFSGVAYGSNPPLGVLLGIITALCYGGYLMVIRRASGGRTAEPITISTASTAVVSLAVGLAIGSIDLVPSLPSHLWLILLGVTAQAAGYLLITYSLPRLPAVTTSIILLAQPVMSIFLAMLIVREAPSVEQFVGVAFVIGGIALATLPVRSRRQPSVDPSVASSPS